MRSFVGSRHRIRVAAFKCLQRTGIHVTRNHFYEPVPDTRKIPENTWTNRSQLIGIEMNDTGQLRLLAEFCAGYKKEFDQFPQEKPASEHSYYLSNGLFGSVDGEVLYSMVRHFKPRIILEVGSGNSTFLSAQALLKNRCETGKDSELIAVEPYPNEALRSGFPGLTKLISSPIQDVELSQFERLVAGDILFIDSSHVLKIGSDVQFEYLEILPRLKPGVIVHFHDIFLPASYPKAWVHEELRFWNEQYLLQAFLSFNGAFEVLWAGNYMNLRHPDRLQSAFSSYIAGRTVPGSFWVRKIS